jgi:hypothetical protein
MMVQQPEAKNAVLVTWRRKMQMELMEIGLEGVFLPH